ncbi:unnamed protein product [Moneuplotes crassus]|uniref:Uncharacterized protein n=1 Tax=Euplotes crassus TaxID=5936 RepID=A0AAD1U3L3_EUPCR|nr:unnamed protein product [Moneuplotes crassus]
MSYKRFKSPEIAILQPKILDFKPKNFAKGAIDNSNIVDGSKPVVKGQRLPNVHEDYSNALIPNIPARMSKNMNLNQNSNFCIENQNLRKIFSNTEINEQIPKNMQQLNSKLKNLRLILDGQDYILSPKARTKNKHIKLSHELNSLIKLKSPSLGNEPAEGSNNTNPTNHFVNITQIIQKEEIKPDDLIPQNHFPSQADQFSSQGRERLSLSKRIHTKGFSKTNQRISNNFRFSKNVRRNKFIGHKNITFKHAQNKRSLEKLLNIQLNTKPYETNILQAEQEVISTENRKNRNMTQLDLDQSDKNTFYKTFNSGVERRNKITGKIIHGSNIKNKRVAKSTVNMEPLVVNAKSSKIPKIEERCLSPILAFASQGRNHTFSVNYKQKLMDQKDRQ